MRKQKVHLKNFNMLDQPRGYWMAVVYKFASKRRMRREYAKLKARKKREDAAWDDIFEHLEARQPTPYDPYYAGHGM